jgi:hypothetical protein
MNNLLKKHFASIALLLVLGCKADYSLIDVLFMAIIFIDLLLDKDIRKKLEEI